MHRPLDSPTETAALDPVAALHAGHFLPSLEALPADALPEPYRGLLAHDRDMTPTLEAFHGQSLGLRVLDKRMEGDGWLFREVALVGEADGRAVEYGLIRIHADAFDAAARAEVLACRRPLGAILRDHAVPHTGRPRGFFRVEAGARVRGALGLDAAAPAVLYGRRNRIHAEAGGPLADILEILPP